MRRKPYGEKHIIGFLFTICILLTAFLAALLSAMVALRIPDIRTVSQYKPLQTSYILDRHGNVLERIYTENRTLVSLSRMPELLPQAFVAAEDGRFFEHPGLDFISVIRAASVNIKRGGRAQGGSTITQQVARSLLLSREKTYLRKFKEAILAWRIDSLLSKEDILYIYLNQIYLGEGAYGVEAASQVYFNKHVHELSLAEIAVLAGLPQAPSRYSPLKNYAAAIKRQRYVLNRMAADGYIDTDEARRAFEQQLQLAGTQDSRQLETGYYNEIVKKRTKRFLRQSLFHSGIKIYTYLDANLQEAAVEALRAGVMASFGRQVHFKKHQNGAQAPQGALVSIAACSGEVRALLGGTDFSATPYDRAAMARRPAGSAFKPVIFSAALSNGWNSSSLILDGPLAIAGGAQGVWRPQNYSGTYHGRVTLSDALVHSYNTAAVRLLQKVGLNPVHSLSENMGITSEMPGDLSLALGSVDVTLLELTAAYSSFVCNGVYSAPVFIRKIEGADGSSLYQGKSIQKRVLTEQVAAETKMMLSRVITEGTASRAAGLPGPSGGKTGTSDDNRDAWFIGFHHDTIGGIWVGHDKNQSLGNGENGGRTAAPIWFEYMEKSSKFR
ncbi:MAG: PBP1A family penicillin-binding protein [Desulfopila sp.]|nr:PBP1A family penicillin-binding protein [Desulfopila sp.]